LGREHELRPRSGRVARAIGGLSLIAALGSVVPVQAQPDPFAICTKQRYALCATASCLVYNGVAYCKCDVKFGESISAPYPLEGSGDVCSVNRQGYGHGYMMSTYSLPPAVIKGGNKALYTCPGDTSDGAYAQCDGGFCFASTRARKFPGFPRLKANEIICSCPITVADPAPKRPGYQMVGPYPCREEFFDNCSSDVANTNTGSRIVVGAPTGIPVLLTRELYGRVPELNRCELPR
jgi:hypothetical protein